MWFLTWVGHLYMAMWSNIWAPSFWTLLGIGMSHAHQVYLQNKHHEEQMGRVSK